MRSSASRALSAKVEATLARFDTAVKESSTRSIQSAREKQAQREDLQELADRITAEAEEDTPPGKPTCRPWDYTDFTSRLGTFTPFNWFAKPPFASPLMCARYGWVNTGRDALACECCKTQLQYSSEQQCAGSFLSLLKSRHHALCPWNGNACPVEFLQLPPMAAEDWRSEFLARLDTLTALATATALPEVSLPSGFEEQCPGGLSTLATKSLSLLASRSRCSDDPTAAVPAAGCPGFAGATAEKGSDSAVNRLGDKRRDNSGGIGGDPPAGVRDEVLGTAAAIAMFGWRAVSTAKQASGGGGGGVGENPSPRLFCAVCNRRVATDNFLAVETRSKPISSGGDESNPEAAAGSPQAGGHGCRSGKRRRLSGGGTPLKAMDLAAEHRSFCPWAVVHPVVEGENAMEGAAPGWQQSLQALLSRGEPQQQTESRPVDVDGEGFKEEASGKAEEALQKVQKVLGVLMRV